MNIGEHPQPRQPRIKLGPDGELEEAMPVPEIGTFRRSRLRRIADAIIVRREPPPSPDAETLNRFLSMGLTTRPTTCDHCGTRWPAGSKQYCVTCGYPLRTLGEKRKRFVWGAIYLASLGAVFLVMVGNITGNLDKNIFGLSMIVCIALAIYAQIAGGFGKFGNPDNRN